VLWLVLLVRMLRDRSFAEEPAKAGPPADPPQAAIVVPARNEAHQIVPCLRSLLAQDWPRDRLRVICVDDRSEDGTWDAARSLLPDDRLVLVRGTELPLGWLGKNHANAQGVEHAGEARWLLFTDADTLHAPAALSTAIAAAERAGCDLYSLFSDLRLESFWEKALLPAIISAISAAFPARQVNDPQSSTAIANGQFLLVRRGAYEAVGGHGAIKDRVADDLELARLLKGRGFRLRIALGRSLVSVRMYSSLREIWWGFVKNASAGSGGPLAALAGAALLVLSAAPFAALPIALALRQPLLAWVAAAGVTLSLASRVLAFQLFTAPLGYALLLPLGQLALAGIAVHSALRQWTGKGPRWKGRAYPHAR
jgi:chlorobactene glucosyltransferase